MDGLRIGDTVRITQRTETFQLRGPSLDMVDIKPTYEEIPKGTGPGNLVEGRVGKIEEIQPTPASVQLGTWMGDVYLVKFNDFKKPEEAWVNEKWLEPA